MNSKNIDAGDRVVFTGKLKSDWDRCVRFKKVSLFKGDKKVLTKETGRSGASETAGVRLDLTFTLTTAGITRSATATKAVSSASRIRADSGGTGAGRWARAEAGASSSSAASASMPSAREPRTMRMGT